MSIAEKLTTVAENQQRVYDAGFKKAIERYAPEFTESGASVVCYPIGGFPLNVVSQITPIQAGSGDASPTNIRPITAHTSVTVNRCGQNMLDISRLLEAANWSVDENGVYYGDTMALFRAFRHDTTDGLLKGCFNPNTRYTIMLEGKNSLSTAETAKATIMPVVKYTDGSQEYFGLKGYDYTVHTFVTAANKTVEKIGVTYNYAGTEYIKRFTVCEGEVATTEPYQANKYTTELPQDAYCGTFDWSTGLLTLTHKMQTLTGNENGWVKYSTTTILNHTMFDDSTKNTSSIWGYCSHVKTETSGGLEWNALKKANVNSGFESKVAYWGLPDNEVATWTNYLKEQMLNGTPVQVLYQLEVPITVQLAPQEILALDGANTIQSTTGDTTVTGKADGMAMVAQLTESIISLGGEI